MSNSQIAQELSRLGWRLLLFWLLAMVGYSLGGLPLALYNRGPGNVSYDELLRSLEDLGSFIVLLYPGAGISWLATWVTAAILHRWTAMKALSRKNGLWFALLGLIAGFVLGYLASLWALHLI